MATPNNDSVSEPVQYSRGARIVFQPIVDLKDWTVVGFEALARFDDGTTPPDRLAAAEASGHREQLELDLIQLAVQASAPLPENTFITMNASGTAMLHCDLPMVLASSSHQWGLELYEGATPVDLGTIRRLVSQMGGQLLVDDAGASSADASRITTLGPDVVKIERILFWEVIADATARDRLEPLIAATRSAGARLLIEGVAEKEHVDRARELGADLAQGFYLGMPTPAEEMLDALRELHRSIGVNAPGL